MKKYILLSLLVLISGCVSAVDIEKQTAQIDSQKYQIYPEHLDYLCENVVLPNGKESLLTHIYCEAPDYKYIEAVGEGISCIDDVARAGVFYLDYYNSTGDKAYLDKVERCAEFVLYLHQTDKSVPGYGYFYNFVDRKDGNLIINKNGITSKAEPNWWTWRAMWFLGYIYPEIAKISPTLAAEIKTTLGLTFQTIDKDFTFQGKIITEKGMKYASWLPNYGADQSAIILMALVYYRDVNTDKKVDASVIVMMNNIAEGLLVGQIDKAKSSDLYGAFLCWKNAWHGWGNNIAYSLLLAGENLNNQKYIDAALLEINHFQKYLIKVDYLKEFNVKKVKGKSLEIIPDSLRKFEQIAYAMRPMIYACIEAYTITKDQKYLGQAETLTTWFLGTNPAKVVMYNPLSKLRKGLVFDGINSNKSWNKNSGAESTIEALLALQKLQTIKTIK
jgi:hypothetical protein